MKTELLADKSSDEVAEIWREYHSKKDAVSAVIPANTYATMRQRFQEFKTVRDFYLRRSRQVLEL